MTVSSKIITVGLCPSWDMVCRLEGIDWGQHKLVSSAGSRPAGKALNISRALAWMRQRNTAAGLWGVDDYEQMLKAVRSLGRLLSVKMTIVAGATRQNVTVVDTVNNREMHLRAVSRLASKKALAKLRADLEAIVNRKSVCVFAGSMPAGQLLGDVVRIIKSCRERGAKIVVDTHGDSLKRILETGGVWLIKPNVEELCELAGGQTEDNPSSLAKAGRKLLDKVEIILISRGKKGAIAVTREGAWQGRCAQGRKSVHTVGCGDYLLAGFLKGLKDKSGIGSALETAIKVATAKAWGWTDEMRWLDVQKKIKVSKRGG